MRIGVRALLLSAWIVPAAVPQPAYLESLGAPAGHREREARLLTLLDSSASRAERNAAIRELSLIGSDASVPPLARLLLQPDSAEMALYALTRIPGAVADEALRSSLARTSGAIRIGIVHSLGKRRDGKAASALRQLLASAEPGLSEAAAGALGDIGTMESLEAISAARRNTAPALGAHLAQAYLQCAARLAAGGNKAAAAKAYRELLAGREAGGVRAGALGGLAATAPAEAVGVLTRELESSSSPVRAEAIRLLAGSPAPEATRTLIRLFPKLPPADQLVVLAALADRGDRAAAPLLVTIAGSGAGDVRAGAISGLAHLGDPSSVKLFAEVAAAGRGVEQDAARAALYRMRGAGVDRAIVDALGSTTGKARVELIVACGERGITEASDHLSRLVRDPDAEARREAWRALRGVAGSDQVPALLQLLTQAASALERREITQTLGSILRRSESSGIREVVAAYQSARAKEAQIALLEVMGQSSSDIALPLLRNSLSDPAPEIARAAILALSEWGNTAPMPDLLAIAQQPPSPALQVLALRGYLKLVALSSVRPAAESARLLAQALRLAGQTAEKRAVLALLPAFPCKESLEVAEQATKDPDVATEAVAAVERIRGLIKSL